MDLRVTIESLFGHLCFGSTFAHDEEMKALASQRGNLKSTTDGDLQIMTSSRDGSVDQPDTSPVSLVGSASDPESLALDDLERVPKRPRTSQSFSHQGNLHMSTPTEGLSPNRQLPLSKQSFKRHIRQSKRKQELSTRKSTDPLPNQVGGSTGTSRTAVFSHQESFAAPHLKYELNTNTFQNERLAGHPIDVHHGTEAQPIELSDEDPFSQGNEGGAFLLEEMPEPNGITSTLDDIEVDPETQVTLSDAAFESQSSHNSNPNIKAMRLQRRKEAYKAAKEPSGIWEVDHGLISSSAHHGDEEVEL